jgi:hypothetical protein
MWYEPKWLAYRYINSEEAHPFAHAQYMEWDTNPEKHELVVKWREWERDRIIKQIDEWLANEAERLGTTYIEIWTPNFSDQLKQLIKGDTK